MNNFYNLTSTELSSSVILINVIFSLVLQLVIVWTYKKTHKGLSYSPSFIFTLAIVGLLGTLVMMVVQNNLIGAFALLGAFSLIRFRTILKETRDIAFVFFALVIGVAVGTSNYAIAIIGTIFVTIVILLFTKYNIGSIKNGLGFILTFNARDDFDAKLLQGSLSDYAEKYQLLQARSHDEITTFVYSVNPTKNMDATRLLQMLKKCPGLSDIELITGEHSVEY